MPRHDYGLAGALNLNNGLVLSGGGTVNLGSNGNPTVNDGLSGMSGGSLTANNQYVGNGGTGSFTHSAGTNTLANNLYLGYNPADRGTYNLSGTGVLSVFDGQSDGVCPPTSEYVGYSGTGLFTQSGGSNSIYCWYSTSGLYVGYNSGSTGIYTLSGGTLSVTCGYEAAEFVGYSGTGTFLQSGGTNNVASTQNLGGSLCLGWNSGASGTYNLSGTGTLKASYFAGGRHWHGGFSQSGGTANVGGIDVGRSGTGTVAQSAGTIATGEVTVGVSGTGVFSQSGGVTTISNYLTLGYNPGSNGTSLLSGAGRLSAPTETIGSDPAATALFDQSGGTNTTNYLAIGTGGCYQLSGGTLAVGNVGLVNQGLFEGGPGTLTANCLVDLTAGLWGNLSRLSVNMGPNSLLIVPPGFNTATGLGSYSSLGLTHVAGTTLTVPAGTGFGGIGSINDPVVCQGTITASQGYSINLNNGLVLSGNGSVNLALSGVLRRRRFVDRQRRRFGDKRRDAVCDDRVHWKERHGNIYPNGRDQFGRRELQHRCGADLSGLQLGRQRDLRPERHRRRLRDGRVRGLQRHGRVSRSRAAPIRRSPMPGSPDSSSATIPRARARIR